MTLLQVLASKQEHAELMRNEVENRINELLAPTQTNTPGVFYELRYLFDAFEKWDSEMEKLNSRLIELGDI